MTDAEIYEGTLRDKMRQFIAGERPEDGPRGGLELAEDAIAEIKRLHHLAPEGPQNLMTVLRRSMVVEDLKSIISDPQGSQEDLGEQLGYAVEVIEDMLDACGKGGVNPGVCAADARDAAISARIRREGANFSPL